MSGNRAFQPMAAPHPTGSLGSAKVASSGACSSVRSSSISKHGTKSPGLMSCSRGVTHSNRIQADSVDSLKKQVASLLEQNKTLEEESRITRMRFYEYVAEESRRRKEYDHLEEQLQSADRTIDMLMDVFDGVLADCGFGPQKDLLQMTRESNLRRKQHNAHTLAALAVCATATQRGCSFPSDPSVQSKASTSGLVTSVHGVESKFKAAMDAHAPRRQESSNSNAFPHSRQSSRQMNNSAVLDHHAQREDHNNPHNRDDHHQHHPDVHFVADAGQSPEGEVSNRSHRSVSSDSTSNPSTDRRPSLSQKEPLKFKVPGLLLGGVGAGTWLAGEATAGDTYQPLVREENKSHA